MRAKLLLSVIVFISSFTAGEEFVIKENDNHQRYPRIAKNGDNCLVVWQDKRDGEWDIWGRILTKEGETVGEEFVIEEERRIQFQPVVGEGDEFWLVIYLQSAGGGEVFIYGKRVNLNGEVVGNRIVIKEEEGLYSTPYVGWNGSEWLVVWTENKGNGVNIYGKRIDEQGNIIGGEIVISEKEGEDVFPHCSWVEGVWLVVWENNNQGETNIYAQFVREDGSLQGEVIEVCAEDGNQKYPQGIEDGESKWLIVWSDFRGDNNYKVYAKTIDKQGNLGQEREITTEGNSYYPTGGWCEEIGKWWVIWSEYNGGEKKIKGRRVGEVGLEETKVFSEGKEAQNGEIEIWEEKGIIVWEDERKGEWDIYGFKFLPLEVEERREKERKMDLSGSVFFKVVKITSTFPQWVRIYDITGKEVGRFWVKEDIKWQPNYGGIYFIKSVDRIKKIIIIK